MRINWSEMGLAAMLLGGACATVFAVRRRLMRRSLAEQRAASEQIAALNATVEMLRAQIVEMNRLRSERHVESPAPEPAGENFSGETTDPMKPEMLAVISAAATVFLGKTARVR